MEPHTQITQATLPHTAWSKYALAGVAYAALAVWLAEYPRPILLALCLAFSFASFWGAISLYRGACMPRERA